MNFAHPRFTRVLPLLASVGLLLGQATPAAAAQVFNQTLPVTFLVTACNGDAVTATGILQPRDYVDVGTQVSGQVKKLHVEIGSAVKAGQLIAEIDPTVYLSHVEANQAQLRTQQAQLQDRQAQLALAEQQHQRQVNLMRDNATTQDAPFRSARMAFAVSPFETAIVSPVSHSQPSAIRKVARFCSSSIFPTRRMGFSFDESSKPPPGRRRFDAPSVGKGPGAIALRRMPKRPHSTASDLVITCRPAFDIAEGTT